MKTCEFCPRPTRGNHKVCKSCWMLHVWRKQGHKCALCGWNNYNEPKVSLTDLKWSKYNIMDPSHSEVVCKRCHKRLKADGLLSVNNLLHEIKGCTYHNKLTWLAVQGHITIDDAYKISARLEKATADYILSQGVAKHPQTGGPLTGNFRKRTLKALLLEFNWPKVVTMFGWSTTTRTKVSFVECNYCQQTVAAADSVQVHSENYCADCAGLIM